MANRLPRYREQGVRTGRRLPGTGRLLLRTTVSGEEVFYGTWYAGGRRLKRRIGAKRGRNERGGGLTTNQAEEQLRRMIAATAARPRVDDRLNITELGALYIANARRRGRKRSTLLNVESYVRVHFQPFFRDRPVETIEPADVIRLMGKLEQAGKTPKTIRNILATLSALFNFAIAPHRRFAAFNPCAGIELPAAPEPEEIRFLTLDQVDLLLDHIRPGILAHIDKPLLLAAVVTGMRKGELVALRWRDVDFTAGRLRVRRNYTCGEFGTPQDPSLYPLHSTRTRTRRRAHRPALGLPLDAPRRPRLRPPRPRRRPAESQHLTPLHRRPQSRRHRRAPPLPRPPPHLRHPHGRLQRPHAHPPRMDGPPPPHHHRTLRRLLPQRPRRRDARGGLRARSIRLTAASSKRARRSCGSALEVDARIVVTRGTGCGRAASHRPGQPVPSTPLFSSDRDLPEWWRTSGASELLSPLKDVVPVLGAGISIASGLPSGAELAKWLSETAPLRDEPSGNRALFPTVDAIDSDKMPIDLLRRQVASYVASFPLDTTPFLEALVHLPSRFIITLNYDDLVATVAERQGMRVSRFSALDKKELHEAHRRFVTADRWPPTELTVLHLHGRATAPETLVLDSDSYAELSGLAELDGIVHAGAYFRRFAFAGTDLDEIYLLAKLQTLRNTPLHAFFGNNSTIERLSSGRAALSARQNLKLISYAEHEDLIALPSWLNTPQEPRSEPEVAQALDRDGTPDAADYVMSEFDESERGVPVQENDVLTGHRTIVVGGAGAGKTHLLSWIAANAPQQRPAVRIRLGDVRTRAGAPELVLAAWAKRARSAPDGKTIDVSESALREDRLHFLLDGLDEVDNERQDSAAALILQIAARYPQHAFTVTSRPIASLEAFASEPARKQQSWRTLRLTPGAEWQQRFLASKRMTLDDLEAFVPALLDMRELLQIPFFLTRTVDLFDSGALDGVRDVGDLLSRLVDFALDREEDLLPLIGGKAAREWLQRVALTTVIGGHRSLSFDALRRIPAGDTVGDLDELVQQLQLRLLLSEESGQVRFSHRLLADGLAAEALSQIRPSRTLLDVLVPRLDAQLHGVRDDIAVMVGLLCLRSSSWRHAVADRDPLAAARATPTDAESAEQMAAVDLIWRTYERWGIWIWDRSAEDLLEDAEVIGRLLRHDPDGPKTNALRRLIDDGDEIQQGNAIRVLTRAMASGLAADLGRVLRDPSRNGVVIRQAAIAASDLGLVELVDDIVYAMLEASDTAIGQDGAIALQRLIPESRLFEITTRLVRARKGGTFAYIAREKMSPAERILLCRDLALAGGDDVLSSDRDDLRAAAAEVTPTSAIVQAAACAGVVWRDNSEAVKDLLDRDPRAAAAGVVEACNQGTEWWNAVWLAPHADLEMLKAAGAPTRVIDAVEWQRQIEAMTQDERDELRRAQEAEMAAMREELEHNQIEPARTLAHLLTDPSDESDAEIQARAFHLQNQVAELNAPEMMELRERLSRWWPDRPFRELVRSSGRQMQVAPAAGAWLFLGAAVDMPVSDDQWAELATLSVSSNDQTEWLRRHATEPRMRAAAARMTETSPSAWQDLMDCCSLPLPNFIGMSCARVVQSEPDRLQDSQYLVRRLVSEFDISVALMWAQRDEPAARALRPHLAAAGDLVAQRQLVSELATAVREGRGKAVGDLDWLSSLRSPVFLDELFEILERMYPLRPDEGPVGSSADVLNGVIEAIEAIGTRDAVSRFDALFEKGNDLRWLRRNRERIAARLLAEAANRAVPSALVVVGLPTFLDDPPLPESQRRS